MTTIIPPIICEYCSNIFQGPLSSVELKVKFKNVEHLLTIVVCPPCLGQLAQYNGVMPEGAVELYKIHKYKFPTNKKLKREDNSLLTNDSKRPLFRTKK